MYTIDPKQNEERENYKLLTGSIVPRPIAFITSLHGDVLNGAPFSYFNIVSANPPMISLAIQRKAGVMKDTARNITATEQFVVHMVDWDNVTQINETAANLAPHDSEVLLVNLTPIASAKVKVPGVKEAKVRMECQLVHHKVLGDQGTDLLIGEIVQFHFDEQVYNPDTGRINSEELQAVSRLAGNSYATIGSVFDKARPK